VPPPASAWMRISELSRRVDVSADTLRVWERRYGLLKPRRTRGNARLYSSIDEARIRLMKRYLRSGVPTAQAAELASGARFSVNPGRNAVVVDAEAARTATEMREALDRFDETSAQHALEKLLAEYSSLAVIRDVLLPYLHGVGERWAAGHMTIAQEHFASNFLLARLLGLARGWDRGLGPRALLACAPGEDHTLALIAFGIALHHLGWRITYLGPATPVNMIASAARQLNPDLITISCTVNTGLDRHAAALREISHYWPVALAGAGANAQLATECGARYVREDPVSAAYAIATSDAA
jgi:MerR family transcriptional regulator, light-induced transcriptional regulator